MTHSVRSSSTSASASTFSSYTILIGLIILIVGSPIAVGSVYIVTYSAMEIIVFVLLLIHIWTFRSDEAGFAFNSKLKTQNSKPEERSYLRRTFFLTLPLLLFLLVVLFQFLPLPFRLIETISPATASLYGKLGMGYGYRPLTLSVYATSIMFLKWTAYIGAFILVATFNPTEHNLRNGGWIRILFIALFAVAFGEAVYGLYVGFNRLDLLLWFHRKTGVGSVAGTWVNPDHFAGYLNMAFFCSLGLCAAYMRPSKKRRRGLREAILRFFSSEKTAFFWILLLGIFAMILGVFFAISRAAHIGMFIGLMFVITVYSMKKINIASLAIMSVVTVAVSWAMWQGIEPILDKWSRVENALYEDRLLTWKATGDMIAKFPVFGTGFGAYEMAYPPYKPARFGATVYEHAHSDYLEILSETGSIGFVTCFSFFGLFLFSSIKQWFARHDRVARALGAGGIAAVITMLIHFLVDFNLQIPANALTLFIIMGLTWRTLHSSFREG